MNGTRAATTPHVAETLAAIPVMFLTPFVRRWHLHWGATSTEVLSAMPGDGVVPISNFSATRAITIDAPPAAVWPWLTQVGVGRGGFYSYDLIDNQARPSADRLDPKLQEERIGELAAPMTNRPTPATSFRVEEAERARFLVWTKRDSSWSWTLRSVGEDRTRLVTRLKARYAASPAGLLTMILMELGDFVMMRKMLLGIKMRAEQQRG